MCLYCSNGCLYCGKPVQIPPKPETYRYVEDREMSDAVAAIPVSEYATEEQD